MGFYKKLKYYLVHSLSYTNKAAQQLIDSGAVTLNGNVVTSNCALDELSEIAIHHKIVKEATSFVYLKFNKPVGYQSSLNADVENNLSEFFTGYSNLAIAGRLDKQSQGLMLLSNDGKWVELVCNPKFEKEKEYFVTLNKQVTSEFVNDFKSGVNIGDYLTKPCFCEVVSDNQVKVILKEGKNRQIRKMCKTLGYEVVQLLRTRIAGVWLDQLKSGRTGEIKKF